LNSTLYYTILNIYLLDKTGLAGDFGGYLPTKISLSAKMKDT